MDWSDDEGAELQTTWETRGCLEDVASRAVELKAARSGTMTADVLQAARSWVEMTEPTGTGHGSRLLAHITTLGARAAVLEAENAKCLRLASEACAKSERLEKATQSEAVWRKRLEAVAEELADVGAGECGRLDIVTRVRMLKAQLAALSLEMAKAVGEPPSACPHDPKGGPCDDCSMPERSPYERWPHPNRYPCSASCTHDDAATPGHAERVKERSEAVQALSKKILPGPDVVDGGPGTRGPVRTVSREARHAADSYAEGAEAMRAACWEAVQAELEKEGLDMTSGLASRVKAAIEGAAP